MARLAILGLLLVNLITSAADLPLQQLQLPLGFSVSIYAAEVKNAREMALGDKGTVFVGSTNNEVYALKPDPQHPGKATVTVIASGLNQPNGVAFYKGALYVAEINKITRYNKIETSLDHPPTPVLVTDDFPLKDRYPQHHAWKTIHFSPDGRLYVAVGAPCNSCLPQDPRFGTLMRLKPDGKHLEIYAKGVRNSVGFDWDPKTGKLWFTDNGRDWMGDHSPPDKLNYAPVAGLHFGFPYYYGLDKNGKPIPDPKFGKLAPATDFTFPKLGLTPHAATLGLTFYTGNQFPSFYRDRAIIAEHGSWNSSKKVGYRLTTVRIKQDKADSYQPFVTGWLNKNNDQVWGRPVATLVLADGSLLVSDDKAGVIYRITYRMPST